LTIFFFERIKATHLFVKIIKILIISLQKDKSNFTFDINTQFFQKVYFTNATELGQML